LLLAVFCLFFILINGVSASDVSDVSNNSSFLGSDETTESLSVSDSSVALDTNSNENDISISNVGDNDSNRESLGVSSSTLGEASNSLSISSDEDSIISSNSSSNSSVSNSTVNKTSTSLNVLNNSIYCGQSLVAELSANDKALANKTVYFDVVDWNKTYTRTTDASGQASLKFTTAVSSLNLVIYFNEDSNYKSSKYNGTLKINVCPSTITPTNLTVYKGSNYVVTLKNSITGAVLTSKTIYFNVVEWNKTYKRTTNSNGKANLTLNTNDNITIITSFAGDSSALESSNNSSITIAIPPTNIVGTGGSIAIFSPFVITLKNKITGKVLTGQKVVFYIEEWNKTYKRTTNSNGKANLTINTFTPLNITVSYDGSDSNLASSKNFTLTPIKATAKITASSVSIVYGGSLIVSLKHSVSGAVLSGKKVIFNITNWNKTYTRTTNSSGMASMDINTMTSLKIIVSYKGDNYYNASNSSFTLKMSKAKTSLNPSSLSIFKGGRFVITLKDVWGNALSNKKIVFTIYGKSYTHTTNSSGQANLKVNLAKGTYTVKVSFAGDTSYNASSISKSLKVKVRNVNSNQNSKILNWQQDFDKSSFAKYLVTGGYSALNSAIKAKAAQLTKGLTTTFEKATAIFEFVRDKISYSYYSDSKKGASGTLSSGSANCCDQANLVVALCRAAGLYSRYSHAQGCTFSSGLVTGHVWAQIYDEESQTWYSADATSSRNSLGNIKNWNTNSYSSAKNYALISF